MLRCYGGKRDSGVRSRRPFHLYAHALFSQLAQLATCNRLHSIEQRCCWLLMTHDRVEGNEFGLTHDFLSEMLGVRRAGVTVILGNLQQRGLIQYRRGRLTVRYRKGLEKRACECYSVVRGEFDRLLEADVLGGWRARTGLTFRQPIHPSVRYRTLVFTI